MKYLILLLCLLISFSFAPDKPWKKELDKNGVQVYLRECAGCELKEFKAQAKVNAPMNKIMTMLLDFRNYPKWVFGNRGTFTLTEKSKTEFVYYTLIESPKPTQDRDLIVNFKIAEQTDKHILVKTSNLPKYIGEKPNIIRVKEFNGTWELSRISDTETLVTTTCYTTPGGTVPAWIINTFITTGPYNTLLKLREMVAPKKS